MALRAHLSGYRWLRRIRSAALRMGIYVGVCISLVLTVWLIVANRVPFLERFAWERNLAGAVAVAVLAALPVLRFLRSPGRLLLSGLVAWTIVSLVYRVPCLYFSALGDRLGAFHLFILGSIIYLFAAVVVWIASLIWGMRAHAASHSGHRLS